MRRFFSILLLAALMALPALALDDGQHTFVGNFKWTSTAATMTTVYQGTTYRVKLLGIAPVAEPVGPWGPAVNSAMANSQAWTHEGAFAIEDLAGNVILSGFATARWHRDVSYFSIWRDKAHAYSGLYANRNEPGSWVESGADNGHLYPSGGGSYWRTRTDHCVVTNPLGAIQ